MGSRGSSSGASSAIPKSNVKGFKGKISKDSFFGEVAKISNQYMMFDQVTDKDNAIIMTSDVKVIKSNMVMMTGENTAVYLKPWQFRLMENNDAGIQAFAVKLSRKYFKEYTFKSGFDDYGGQKETFDSLWKTAASQQRRRTKWKAGKRVIVSNNSWYEM